ncbi:MAG: hypothetical protein LBF50_01120 [Azoarcus sp.]|jgi:hypothetical protein|nr:hypothetical protein [Azoarcus sp.]
MASIENNDEDWREIRSRADSIASTVFLISGGALSLSITVILGNKGAGFITTQVASFTIWSWYLLLGAIILFLLLKGYMVFQAYLLQFCLEYVNNHLRLFNGIGWSLGAIGFIAFVIGMILMVYAAAIAVTA